MALLLNTFTFTAPKRTDFFPTGVGPTSSVAGWETGTNFSSFTTKSVLLAIIQSTPRMTGKGGCLTEATRFNAVCLPSHLTAIFTNESIATDLLSHPRKRTLGPTQLSSFLEMLRRTALELAPESTNATTSPTPSICTLITGRGELLGDLRYPVKIGPAPSGEVTFLEKGNP